MKQLRNNVIRAGLGALYFSGAHHLLRPLLSGVGAIFMLHHVRPARDAAFQPNRHLEVTPEFLRATLSHLRSREIDIVSMDELHERLVRGRFDRSWQANPAGSLLAPICAVLIPWLLAGAARGRPVGCRSLETPLIGLVVATVASSLLSWTIRLLLGRVLR